MEPENDILATMTIDDPIECLFMDLGLLYGSICIEAFRCEDPRKFGLTLTRKEGTDEEKCVDIIIDRETLRILSSG